MPTITFSLNTSGADFGGIEDGGANVNFPSTAYGSAAQHYIGGNPAEEAIFIRLTAAALDEIPAGATIDSVTLRLWQTDNTGAGNVQLQRLLRDWVAAEATATVYSSGNNWQSSVANGANDREATASATVARGSNGVYLDFSTSGMVSDLEGWIASPSTSNGWRVSNTEAQYTQFRLSEGTDGQRPIIVVEYTAGGGPDYTVEAESGTYTYTGGEATLAASRRLDAQGGAFSYAGGDAELAVSRRIDAQGGIYTYAGGDVGLIASRVLSADGGAYSYAGGTAGLLVSRLLDAQGGSYSYAGGDASFTVAGVFQLAAEGGTFAYAGGDATLTVSRRLSAEGATYAYSGGDAGLYARRALSAQGGTYTYAGGDADLVYNPGVFTLVAEGGTYTFTGGDAALIYSGAVRIRPWPGELVMRPAYSWGDDLTLQRQYPPIPLNLS